MEELLERYKSIPPFIKFLLLIGASAAAVYFSYDASVLPAKADQTAALEEQNTLEEELKSISSVGQSIVALESEVQKADDEINSLVELLPLEPGIDKLLGLFSTAAKIAQVHIANFEPVANLERTSLAPTMPPTLPASAAGGAGSPTGTAPALVSKISSTDDMSNRVVISTTLVGTYSKILSFLDRVTSFTRVVRVGEIEFDLRAGETFSSSSSSARVTSADTASTVSSASPAAVAPKVEKNIVTAKVNFLVYYQKLNKNPGVDALKISSTQGNTTPSLNTGAEGQATTNPAEAAGNNPEGMSAKPLSSKEE